ncbi:frizzled-7-like protein [Leptotrombidium deliense]|uniref:Frizzled-7-like protein n=1 Tax=Leptotrombidium deliense TaxID=299467 RepID=A0A443RVX8_9ACAR|nr:frizzled-7-like protein [Leptotrombidium deliense]
MSKVEPEKCEALTIPMCKGLKYNQTIFPNLLNHTNQDYAALEIHQFWPLIEIKCSPHLKLFICSVYAPICTPSITVIPPCRSLCQSAKNGCENITKQYGYVWPTRLSCELFPQKNNGQICIDVEKKQSTLRTTK